ncbi:hypothetical protein D9757_000592 [Collybiopsis confluens]|uniref:Amino acid transporter transmembrane domain-containing protein n=1 Tax=Collybiopsis confluens TaxID=2823264 RepID=A0A8H5I1U5_9AGAR|nr:hypothetical protein D9757_000592 [Collybiopsis confluens]
MFSSRLRDKNTPQDAESGEASKPLLGDQNVVFSVDDDSDEEPLANSSRREHSVRFQEDVQVIGPPLRSTNASREAEFELDSDELDSEPEPERRIPRGRPDSTMPLIVGLLDSSHRSFESPSGLNGANGSVAGSDLDLDAIAAKRTAGGGLVDSIANMANSILGAGIIGLPYAMSQAGFFMGLILLVTLSGVTDWTIRLIVINAKLSGSHTYIDIMNRCFGSSGRAAVSFFQFSFAFGGKLASLIPDIGAVLDRRIGMCAFGIIIGDTIPHVVRSLFPNLSKIPVLGLLTNRQFVIFLCTTCVSYPLSLYRDIHKLARASGLALISMLIIVVSVIVEGPHVPAELKGDPSTRLSFVNPGVFQAIGVISFAFEFVITTLFLSMAV